MNIVTSLELKELLCSDNLSLQLVQSVDLKEINSRIEDYESTPLHWLCMNKKITFEIIKYVKLYFNANFDNYIEICHNNKKIKISPLSILCQNTSITLEIIDFLKDCNFSANKFEKHKVCSPIFTLCGNPRVTVHMLKLLHEHKHDLYQYSMFNKDETSFDKLFENSTICLDIIKFMFTTYELKVLFKKSSILKLFNNPNIDFSIINFLNNHYERVLKDNFQTILLNPKIVNLDLVVNL